MSAIQFKISHESQKTKARTGVVTTPHGSFQTPAFMPVGTRATVKGLLPSLVSDTNSEIILNNTYHLMLRPGSDLIQRAGGVHHFMRWDGPILTDSGGYQVFSMSDINAIDDDGVEFRSIIDGRKIRLTPERSIQVQNELGADIIMAFDDCPPSVDPASLERTNQRRGATGSTHLVRKAAPVLDAAAHAKRLDIANDRTIRWLERCVASHQRVDEQGLFGIVQGGTDLDRRRQSVEQVCNIDLPGYAIGGVAVGEGTDAIRTVVEHTAPLLPRERPRYLMGVGYEWDLLMAIKAGVDMFDCVLPTRNGRNANAFTPVGQIRLRNAAFAEDHRVIDATCPCHTCRGGFTRAYLRHLFHADEMLGPVLVSLHNIAHFQRLMLDIRTAIAEDDWSDLEARWPVVTGRGAGRTTSDDCDGSGTMTGG